MISYSLPLDHLVISVAHLESAIAEFKGLGFNVIIGGKNGPTHNALIPFKDGTYLELIGIESPFQNLVLRSISTLKILSVARPLISPLTFRFFSWFGTGQSIKDWCLRIQDLESFAKAMERAGVAMGEIDSFARSKPNGEVARWKLAAPRDTSLPFMIQDISPTSLRVPAGSTTRHANRIAGISKVILPQNRSQSSLKSIAEYCTAHSDQKSQVENTKVNLGSSHGVNICAELTNDEGDIFRLELTKGLPQLGAV